MNFKLAFLRFIRGGSKLGFSTAVVTVIQTTLVITYAVLPIVESQAVVQKVDNFANSDKWLVVNLGDPSKLNNSAISQIAKNNLAKFSDDEPKHFIAYRPVSDQQSGRYQLVGSDQLEAEVELVSGRLPKACTTEICEVIIVNKTGLTNIPTGFVVVGEANFVNSSPINPVVESDTPVLLSSQLAEITTLPNFTGFPGTEVWATPLTGEQIKTFGLTNFLNTTNEVANSLALETGQLQLIAPLNALEKTKAQIGVLFNRIVSLELAVCLIGLFTIYLTASSQRTNNASFINAAIRLQPAKISTWRINAFLAGIAATIGTAVGLAIGTISFNLFRSGVEPLQIEFNTLLVVYVSSILVITSALTIKGRNRVVLGGLAIVSWTLFILQNNLQPQIAGISLVAAVLAGGYFIVVNRYFRSKFLKNIFLSNRSGMLATVLVVSFLTTSLLSAVTYLNSLERNAVDNAIFKSPTSTRITMGGEALPMQNNSFSDYENYSASGKVFPIRKVSTTYFQNVLNSFPTQLIGLDAEVWNYVPDITNQTKINLKQSGQLLTGNSAVIGIDIANSKQISLQLSGLNEHTYFSAWVLNDRSESVQIIFVNQESEFVGELPTNVKSLIGFQVTENADFKSRREHAVGEGDNSLQAPTGTIQVTNVLVDGQQSISEAQLSGNYNVLTGPAYFSLVEPSGVIPAIIDSQTAAQIENKDLQLRISNDHSISLKAVEVTPRLPTVPMRFALIDYDALTRELAAKSPELLRVSELWLSNEINPEVRADQELYGLTVLNQTNIQADNFSPTNSTWTVRGIYLLVLSAGLLYLIALLFISNSVFRNTQLFGWQASGLKIKKIQRNLVIRILSYVSGAIAIAVLTTWTLLPRYIEQLAFDINGDVAAPPLVTMFNFAQIIQIALLLWITGFVVLATNARIQTRKIGV
jgi:hypothetical protein